MGPATLLLAALTLAPAFTHAQGAADAPRAPQSPAPRGPIVGALTWSAQYSSAQSASIGLSTVIGRERMAGIVLGPIVEASAGVDAGKLALGVGGVLTADRFRAPAAFGLALQGVGLRSWRRTRATPDPTTYAGFELKVTLSTLKLSGGCLWRVGEAPRSKRVRATWGLGIGF